MGLRILVVGRIEADLRRDLCAIESGTEILDAEASEGGMPLLGAIEPHLLVLGTGAPGVENFEAVPPLPVLGVGDNPDADLVLGDGATQRESVLRSARKLGSMRRDLLAAARAAAEVESARLRHFHELLENEFLRAVRYRHPLSLVLTSIDGARALVRDHGEAPVVTFLEALRSSLQRSVRQVDLVFRLGAEEIAVLLPETRADGAAVVAERLRAQSRRLLFKPPLPGGRAALPIKITSSVGIVDAPREGLLTSAAFLSGAREAVARCRAEGGARAVVHDDEAAAPIEA